MPQQQGYGRPSQRGGALRPLAGMQRPNPVGRSPFGQSFMQGMPGGMQRLPGSQPQPMQGLLGTQQPQGGGSPFGMQPQQPGGMPGPFGQQAQQPGGGLSGLLGSLGARGNPYGSQIQGMIGAGQQQGAFGPGYLRDMMRSGALRTAQGARRRTDVLSQLLGLDPMQQRSAMLESEIGSQGGIADALNSAELQGYGGYQDYLRQLLGGERGFEQQRQIMAMQAKAQKDAQKGGFMGGLGGLLGSVGGSFIPGLGPILGAAGGGGGYGNRGGQGRYWE